jgi:hypothetical protein
LIVDDVVVNKRAPPFKTFSRKRKTQFVTSKQLERLCDVVKSAFVKIVQDSDQLKVIKRNQDGEIIEEYEEDQRVSKSHFDPTPV